LDPISLAKTIEERYKNYLKTTFFFKDPLLRKSFEEALNTGHLCKGPYLEATPPFKKGQTPRTFFPSLLGTQPDEGFLDAVHGDRSLYHHQEEAISKVWAGKNIVAATGTGSGKTESFLYPILLHLYQEFLTGALGPGVRALILYPMNALANDQKDRLGQVCRRLKQRHSPFTFTFGQYIGETPEDENDTQRHAQDLLAERDRQSHSITSNGQVIHGELVLRSEMRATPPNILLTNYSMLEYLLLRPQDSALFDHGQARWWTFLVLDEAHQYRGSRGIEMGMLIRRLKQRLREGGRREPFRCIATSATLAGGEKDRHAVTEFAASLFGEEFDEDCLIMGRVEPLLDVPHYTLQPEDYRLLAEELNNDSREISANPNLLKIIKLLKVPVRNDLPPSLKVGQILRWDKRSWDLRRLVTGNILDIRQIAQEIFPELPEGERFSVLSNLVDLLSRVEDPESGVPLLSPRYHLFLRSLEGAFVSYWPEKKVYLERKAADKEGAAFEVALCKECGQHYFVGRLENGRLQEAVRDPCQLNFGVEFFRPMDDLEEAEGEDADMLLYKLCLICGEVHQGDLTCGHDNFLNLQKEKPPPDEERADQVVRCSACGYHAAGRDPVREVVHGTDGPHAVIATTLYQHLERKKILAFSDGRQEAAFFAWYLGETYSDILNRHLLLQVVRTLGDHSSDGLSVQETAEGLRNLYREQNIFPPAMGQLELRRKAWLSVYKEMLTEEKRISLEGVGLVQWSLLMPPWLAVPDFLGAEPWSFTESEALQLLKILFDTLRTDFAVELRPERNIPLQWNDLLLPAKQMRVRIGDPAGQVGVRSWDGRTGRRASYLVKLLLQNGLTREEALSHSLRALRALWEELDRCERNAPSTNDRLLIPIQDGRRLNSQWCRIKALQHSDSIYQCNICSRLYTFSLRQVCPRPRCQGKLQELLISRLEPNHYRQLYESQLPGNLRVEEHTAQLDREKAREFQWEFRGGKIHVLSCSTTFELGVDLGDLDTIFLRNVPPEAFNYIQRVGRAGRRRGYPGFAITYCRRSPHDLYHFANPDRMLGGRVGIPPLSFENEKIISRHITATALSAFFRAFPERFRNVESLTGDLLNPSGVETLKNFLTDNRTQLEESLKAILNPNLKVGLNSGSWIDNIAGDESRFAFAEIEVSSDYRNVLNIEYDARQQRNYKRAEWARKRANTIAGESVLSFLSRKAVIPKYGFPVDVVELDTQRTQQNVEAFNILLQRDLSIAVSEFAPTSKLIANKKLWASYGLKKVAERELPKKYYKKCPRHNVFIRWEEGHPEPPNPCGHFLPISRYIMPIFGFITSSHAPPRDPSSRPVKLFSSRPYFVGSTSPEPESILIVGNSPLITVKKASPGIMTVLCEGRRGRGFYICTVCGAGFRKIERSHKDPYGRACGGSLEQVALGHEYVTDILQLKFHLPLEQGLDSIWFALSLAYALVEGAAEIIEVPSNDLSATVGTGVAENLPPIILYDNVPGGAGLVAKLEEQETLWACLDAARNRVNGSCGCDEETSCYGCLRNYQNQFAHQKLQRGPVKRYLEKILAEWPL